MMKRISLFAAVVLVLLATTARADEAATEQLLEELATLGQLQGQFSQTQYAAGEEQPVAESSGHFRLLKPSYFSWEITSPDSQLIVSDGHYLWHHDRDLETVSRRPVAGREELSPLQVLAGDTALLRERFTVSRTGLGRFHLQPVSGNPGFKELTLIFAAGAISGMEVLDNLNQRLFIAFTAVDKASPLAPEDFSFTPPEGADLFYHEQ